MGESSCLHFRKYNILWNKIIGNESNGNVRMRHGLVLLQNVWFLFLAQGFLHLLVSSLKSRSSKY